MHLYMRKGGNVGGDKPKYTKSNLPSKTCVVCSRPFEWRKKWEKVWDEVKYCSERCRRDSKSASTGSPVQRTARGPGHTLGAVRSQRSSFLPALLPARAAAAAAMVGYALGGTRSPGGVLIPVAVAATRYIRPTREELASVFEDLDTEPFRPADFFRLDESPDTAFYTSPRFVEHIDAPAVVALTAYHGEQLTAIAKRLNTAPDVLDLCSSWVSHIPPTPPLRSCVGVGMNQAELERNALLGRFLVQDLNVNHHLDLQDDNFDCALLQLSIDYLINPVQVMREIARVLRPGGLLIVSFSNRVFIDKAVAVWTGKPDIDHIETVGRYITLASADGACFDVSTLRATDITPAASARKGGDPLYTVTVVAA